LPICPANGSSNVEFPSLLGRIVGERRDGAVLVLRASVALDEQGPGSSFRLRRPSASIAESWVGSKARQEENSRQANGEALPATIREYLPMAISPMDLWPVRTPSRVLPLLL
jgi:hypothetical protein